MVTKDGNKRHYLYYRHPKTLREVNLGKGVFMIFILPVLFLLLLTWLLRKLGPGRALADDKAKRDIKFGIYFFSGFSTLFLIFTAMFLLAQEGTFLAPLLTNIKELRNSPSFCLIKGTVSEDTEDKPMYKEFAAYYDRIGNGQRYITIRLEDGNILIRNGNYQTMLWERRISFTTVLPALVKHEIVTIGGHVLKSTLDNKIIEIDADFVVAGDLIDLKWYIRSRRVAPGILGLLIIFACFGNLIYAFHLIQTGQRGCSEPSDEEK